VRNYKKGQEVEAIVLAVDVDRERISLGIKQLDGDPFTTFVTVNDKGQTVTGKVKTVDARGAEIDLGEDIVGYLRASEISRDRVEDARNVLKEGDEVTAVVVNVDRKTRNIQLSIKAKDMADQQEAMASLSQQVEPRKRRHDQPGRPAARQAGQPPNSTAANPTESNRRGHAAPPSLTVRATGRIDPSPGGPMKKLLWLLKWLLKAAIFFTLFAFALNNQQDATVHFFFGTQWRAPLVLVVLAAFTRAWWSACWAWCRAGGSTARRATMAPLQRPPAVGSSPAATHPTPWNLISLDPAGPALAFVLGWLASRFDLRQLRAENRRAPKAYFKGLNFLLNEQQDQAIDAFIEAVQNDPDTSELHFALGNLFRRRGEYDRAVRVHEHLLSRGDLPPADRSAPSMPWRSIF
jgi:predicted RNA-binding protein with RPS1 domain/uncharacterized integral membrane protein